MDYLSEGLMILTNDGEMAASIAHPSSAIAKVYEVKVFGLVGSKILQALRVGVTVRENLLKPQSVRVIKTLSGKTWLEFRIVTGRNREIRKMCEAVGLTVDKLIRVAIGGLSIDGIKRGSYRYTSKQEILRKLEMGEYRSNKKTVNLKSKKIKEGLPADDKSFRKFRREHYFKTIESRS